MTRNYQYICTEQVGRGTSLATTCGRICGNNHEPTVEQKKIAPTHRSLGTWHCPVHGRVKVARIRNKQAEEEAA
jgi:hypothetical protein